MILIGSATISTIFQQSPNCWNYILTLQLPTYGHQHRTINDIYEYHHRMIHIVIDCNMFPSTLLKTELLISGRNMKLDSPEHE